MIKKLAQCLIVTLAACGAAHQAEAAENGSLAYPPGSTSIFVASFPPIAGVFGITQFNYTTSSGLYDNNGNKRPIPFGLHTPSETIRLLASYGTSLFGAKMYSQLVVPIVHVNQTVFGQDSVANGVSNITISPLILSWTLPHHQTAVVGLDIATATGSYSQNQLSVAQGYTSFQPVFGYRYNNPAGLDIGATTRLLFNTTNGDTDYHSGSAVVIDYIAGWHLGRFELGAVGAYSNQFAGDTANGIGISNEYRAFKVGPSLTYNAGPFLLNLNFQQDVYIENGAKTRSLWFNVALPLWAPH